jgi:hypothetical protein
MALSRRYLHGNVVREILLYNRMELWRYSHWNGVIEDFFVEKNGFGGGIYMEMELGKFYCTTEWRCEGIHIEIELCKSRGYSHWNGVGEVFFVQQNGFEEVFTLKWVK